MKKVRFFMLLVFWQCAAAPVFGQAEADTQSGVLYHMSCQQAQQRIRDDQGLKSGNRPYLLVHGKPTKQALLLIHGFSASPFETMDLGGFLYSRGYNVYAMRVAGHGSSSQEFNHSTWGQWVGSAEEGLRIAQGLGKQVVIVGHSGGGLLACLLARKYPQQMAGVVLAAPAFKLVDWRAPYSVLSLVRWMIPQVTFEAKDEAHREFWHMQYSSEVVSQLVYAGWAARKTLPFLEMPVLMVQASNDPTVSCSANQQYFRQIASRQKELFIYPSSEHNVLISSNPWQAEVFQVVDRFCHEIPAK